MCKEVKRDMPINLSRAVSKRERLFDAANDAVRTRHTGQHLTCCQGPALCIQASLLSLVLLSLCFVCDNSRQPLSLPISLDQEKNSALFASFTSLAPPLGHSSQNCTLAHVPNGAVSPLGAPISTLSRLLDQLQQVLEGARAPPSNFIRPPSRNTSG